MKEKLPPDLPVSENRVAKKEFPQLNPREVIALIGKKCAPIGIRTYGRGSHKVVILPEAWEELRHMVYFGKKHPVNVFEQQYQGMGHIFVDASDVVTVVVSHFLYIYSAYRSPTSAYIAKGTYDSMMERLESEREIYNEHEQKYNSTVDGYQYDPFLQYGLSEVVFYGHTHPGLGVFFSPDDRKSGYATSTFPAATFVCDPIRKDMKAMVGIEQEEAQVLVCSYVKRRATKNAERSIAVDEKASSNAKNLSMEARISDIARNCNEIIANGAKGKFESYYSSKGQFHVSFNLKCQITNELAKDAQETDVGKVYDSYA